MRTGLLRNSLRMRYSSQGSTGGDTEYRVVVELVLAMSGKPGGVGEVQCATDEVKEIAKKVDSQRFYQC